VRPHELLEPGLLAVAPLVGEVLVEEDLVGVRPREVAPGDHAVREVTAGDVDAERRGGLGLVLVHRHAVALDDDGDDGGHVRDRGDLLERVVGEDLGPAAGAVSRPRPHERGAPQAQAARVAHLALDLRLDLVGDAVPEAGAEADLAEVLAARHRRLDEVRHALAEPDDEREGEHPDQHAEHGEDVAARLPPQPVEGEAEERQEPGAVPHAAPRLVGDDRTVGHVDQPPGVLRRQSAVVRHEDDGRAGRVDVPEELQDLTAGRRIQVARGLVAEEQRGLADETACERDALLLAAAQLAGAVIRAMLEPDALQQLVGAAAAGAAIDAGEHEGERHVLPGGEPRAQMERLEHEAHRGGPEAGQLPLVERRQVASVDHEVAGRGPVETAEEIEERGLPGAGRTEDRDAVAGLDLEVHPAERVDGGPSGTVGLLQIPGGDEGHPGSLTPAVTKALLVRTRVAAQNPRMPFLALAIVCSASIAVLFRLSEGRDANRYAVTSANYMTAVIVGAVLYVAAGGTADDPASLGDRLGEIGGALGSGDRLSSAASPVWAALVGGVAGCSSSSRSWPTRRRSATTASGSPGSFAKLGILLPTVLSLAAWRESPTVGQWAGVGLAVGSLLLVHGPRAGGRSPWLLALFLFGGMSEFANKVFQRHGLQADKSLFLLTTFSGAFVLSLVALAVSRRRIRWSDVGLGIAVGVPNLFSSFFLILALEDVPAVVAFPVYGAGTVLALAAAGVLVFRERLGRAEWAAVAATAGALVLVCL
jgi:multidrug transporter EmrE-like cation transporter